MSNEQARWGSSPPNDHKHLYVLTLPTLAAMALATDNAYKERNWVVV